MKAQLDNLRRSAESELESARSREELTAIRTKYLGRKGLLTSILRDLGKVPVEERPGIGKLSNEIKEYLSAKLDKRISMHSLRHNSESRIIPSYLLVAVQADEFPRVVRAPIA